MKKLLFLYTLFFIFGACISCCYSMEERVETYYYSNGAKRVTLSFSTQFKKKFSTYLKNHASKPRDTWESKNRKHFINYVSLKFDFNGWVVENKGGNALSLEVLYGINSRVNSHDLFRSQFQTHTSEEKTSSALQHMTFDEYDNTFEKYHHCVDSFIYNLRDFIVDVINASNASNISI